MSIAARDRLEAPFLPRVALTSFESERRIKLGLAATLFASVGMAWACTATENWAFELDAL
jgi:hypothetical protein